MEQKDRFGFTKEQQVRLLCVIIPAITSIIISAISIGACRQPSEPQLNRPEGEEQGTGEPQPDVKRINGDILEYLRQINRDNGEKQRLLTIIFEKVRNSLKIDSNNPEINYLYAETLLLSNDPITALNYYDKAKSYFHGYDVYCGLGLAYENFTFNKNYLNNSIFGIKK